MNEFNSHLETLSEHHDIPKVRWHGAGRLEVAPDGSYAGWSWLMLVCPRVLWVVLRVGAAYVGRNWDKNDAWYGVFLTDQYCNIFVRPWKRL